MTINIGDLVQLRTHDEWDGMVVVISQINGDDFLGKAIRGVNPSLFVGKETTFNISEISKKLGSPIINYGVEDES